ncbi:hypothetical protein [Bacillus sp. EAC]|uniref:hypothetical protein n=1 Tax=Bacillus sp. EAC TaxID=1978338 RepID=UPI000B439790|nr:hypothetical protein [Bacillus sp. EAC]
MKKLTFIVSTLAVLLGLTWLVSNFMDSRMIDYAFIVGIIVTIIIRIFTSSGGFLSNSVRLSVQTQTGIKVKEESQVQLPGKSISFLVSAIFTIVSLIITIIYYWQEF